MIKTLKNEFNIPVGYSGHELGLATTLAAVVLGASLIERHITINRAMWGTDQSASIEPQGVARLIRDIRAIESSLGDGVKKSTTVRLTSCKNSDAQKADNTACNKN